MKIFLRNNKGFTLIELLVVVAIIGLLSSVVLASLNGARVKARDAAVKSELIQLRNLIELDRSESSDYSKFQIGWRLSSNTCAIYSVGNYKSQIVGMCDNIVNSLKASGLGEYYMHIGTASGGIVDYSVMVGLPSKIDNAGNPSRMLCVGSSGRISEIAWGDWGVGGPLGCYGNP